MKKYYMHTIDGRPAFFDGNQICYAEGSERALSFNILKHHTLRQIRREQQKSASWRAKQGFDTNMSSYDYLIIYV